MASWYALNQGKFKKILELSIKSVPLFSSFGYSFLFSWKIERKLLALRCFEHNFNGIELGGTIQGILQSDFQLDRTLVTAVMRDSAAVNGVACTILEQIFQQMVDMNCFSHTLDNVGHHLRVPEAERLLSTLINLHNPSPTSRTLWRNRFGVTPKSVSETRWWSRWEFAVCVLTGFLDLPTYIDTLEKNNCSPAHTRELRSLMTDPLLHFQLLVMKTAIEPFVKLTYELEGDGFLIPFVYDELSALAEMCNDPGVIFVDRVPEGEIAKAVGYVKPAFEYFLSRMKGDCITRVAMTRMARYLNPLRTLDLGFTADDVKTFCKSFPFREFQDPQFIRQLIAELPTLKTRAASFRYEQAESRSLNRMSQDIWRWWSR